MKKAVLLFIFHNLVAAKCISQTPVSDSSLRIINFNAHFIHPVDSLNVYQFQINRDSGYYWQLRDAPVGLTINKDNGRVSFKAAKNYFLSGKMKYDFPYKVGVTVQSLDDPDSKIDSLFFISFYNTEIIPSRLKLSVTGNITVEEGQPVIFRVQCETGSFPFETILFSSSESISATGIVKQCGDEFSWTPGFDFVKDEQQPGERSIVLSFIGSTKFQAKDSASVRITVRDALNYPQALIEYELVQKNIKTYILQLKYAFFQLDRKLKKTKTARTVFDLSSAATALTGTILNTSSDAKSQKAGKILPSIGVALVPIKEATAPNKQVEQNQASQIRSNIKRLEYLLTDNILAGEKDNDIKRKTAKLKDELKQSQVQLIDIPVDIPGDIDEGELNQYFESRKVNKKYRLKG